MYGRQLIIEIFYPVLFYQNFMCYIKLKGNNMLEYKEIFIAIYFKLVLK